MPTFIIDDWANQTAREVDVGYEDLDERYVALLAMAGDEDAARWLQAHITAAGDFDESKHPRGGDPQNPGRFSPGEGADERAGDRLQIKSGNRRMSERQAQRSMEKISADVSKFYGSDRVAPVLIDKYGLTETARVVDADTGSVIAKNPEIQVSERFVDRMRDPELGVSDFRVLAHEAIHANVSGEQAVYPGISKTVEEAGAEILSIHYWDQRGQPYDERDSVRRYTGEEYASPHWDTEPGKDSLAASVIYHDDVREVLSRAASAVGWDRDAVIGEVLDVFKSDHMGRIDWRDRTIADFPPPLGVNADAESLTRWLIDAPQRKALS